VTRKRREGLSTEGGARRPARKRRVPGGQAGNGIPCAQMDSRRADRGGRRRRSRVDSPTASAAARGVRAAFHREERAIGGAMREGRAGSIGMNRMSSHAALSGLAFPASCTSSFGRRVDFVPKNSGSADQPGQQGCARGPPENRVARSKRAGAGGAGESARYRAAPGLQGPRGRHDDLLQDAGVDDDRGGGGGRRIAEKPRGKRCRRA